MTNIYIINIEFCSISNQDAYRYCTYKVCLLFRYHFASSFQTCPDESNNREYSVSNKTTYAFIIFRYFIYF